MSKTYKIERYSYRNSKRTIEEGALEELIGFYSYTLENGQSWEHEKGNKKINCNPRSVATLVKNLNNAVNNSAANGYAGVSYSLVN